MAKENYIGGIPERIFQNGFDEFPIRGRSGNLLEGSIQKDQILLQSQERLANTRETPLYLFKAGRDCDDPQMLTLHIRTKRGNPSIKHPDLYASQLVKRSIAYLEDEGSEIRRIKGFWVGGDNHETYWKHITATEKMRYATEADKKEAASSTWTGNLAKRLGFTEVQNVDQKAFGAVKVIFSKP
jgi:hypothetical protein